MKTIYLLLCINIFFISNKLAAQQTTYIPDDNFEQALIDLGYDNILDDYITTSNILAVTDLDIRLKDISDLTGIESFTGLINLNCAYNNLTSLDVSNNIALKELSCAFNQLTILDLQNNNAITYLDCGFNKLDVLDVHTNKFLTVLYCDYNNLVSLDVKNGNNRNFTNFDARYNSNLKCIQVDDAAYSTTNWLKKDAAASFSTNCSGGGGSPGLTYVPDNNFEQALIALGYDNVLDDYVTTANISKVTALDVSNKGIGDLTGIEAFSDLKTLNCAKNNLSVLDLSNNLSLTYLNCSLNSLSDLDVSNNLLLTNFVGFYNNLVSLDVKNGNNRNFTNFDARYNSNLKCIQVDDAAYSTTNWLKKDAAASYNINCGGIVTKSYSSSKEASSDVSMSTQQQLEKSNYRIYPNPVKDVLNINLDYGFKIKQVYFYNAYGQRVLSAKTGRIDVNNLKSGIYFVEIETNQGKSSQKIIVE